MFAQPLPLVGVIREFDDRMAERGSGGLVSGGGQQDEEQHEAGIGERLPVDLRIEQQRDEIVARDRLAFDAQRVEVADERHDRSELGHLAGRVLEVGRRYGLIAPSQEQGVRFCGRTDHPGDDVDRQRHRNLGGEIEGLAGGVLIEQVVEEFAHRRLEKADLAWCEPSVHDLAIGGVLGWVQGQEMLRCRHDRLP